MRTRTEAELAYEARQRAQRAKNYAARFKVSDKDLVFQDWHWQLEGLKRFGAIDPQLERRD